MWPGSRRGLVAATAGLALVGAAASAHAEPRRVDLGLRAPDRLVLGVDGATEISAEAPDGLEVRFFVNVGEIEPLEPAAGRSRARYRLPSTRFPQVAIVVAATEDFASVDWVRIRLHARPTVRFGFEARSTVTVRLGERVFGPVLTDRLGEGELQIEVPPGLREAIAVGTDRLGNVREQPIELSPPPFARTLALCLPSEEAVLLFALGASGGPATSTEGIALTASAGSIDAPRALAPGVFLLGPALEPDPFVEAVEVTASAEGVASSCSFRVRREGPEALTLSLAREAVVEGEPADVEVTLTLRYPGERPPRRVATPELRVSFGEVSATTADGAGGYVATWRLPARGGAQQARIEAQVPDAPGLTAEGRLAIRRRASPRGPFELGARAGLLSNFGKVTGPFAVLSFQVGLGLGPPGALLLGAQAGFWGAWDSRPDQAATEQVDLSVSAVPLLGRVGYRLPVQPLDLFVHLQGGAVVASTAVSSPRTGTSATTTTTWTVGGSLGAGWGLGPGALLLEVGYLHAPLDGDVRGNVAGLHVGVGYDLRLGAPEPMPRSAGGQH
jgi:hypothetical protein